MRSRRAVPIALGVLVALGAVLRLERLGASPLNFDESFTALAARLPIGKLFEFLRVHDSHPPLSYLIQMPIARAGADAFVFRLPGAVCSVAALALFAWWMRDRGLVGVVATGAMAICGFQVLYAREARMYPLMQLIGVGVAFVADAWLRKPRPRLATIAGVLTFVGLMTHVSMILVAVGLLLLPGRRRDVAAWQWRGAIVAGSGAWAALWGSTFLVQARGGHSAWIPRTTPARFVNTISALVTFHAGIAAIVFAAIVAGVVVCWRRDRTLGSVMVCCFVVPALLAGVIGLRAPVLLDRTLSVVAWGPLLALGFVVDAATRRARALGAVAVTVAAVWLIASVPGALGPSGPSVALTELERVVRPGDVVAIQPISKAVELDWTIGVRSDDGPSRSVRVAGLDNAAAIALTGTRLSGRIWLMQLTHQAIHLHHYRTCAPTWQHGPNRMICIVRNPARGLAFGSQPAISGLYQRSGRR